MLKHTRYTYLSDKQCYFMISGVFSKRRFYRVKSVGLSYPLQTIPCPHRTGGDDHIYICCVVICTVLIYGGGLQVALLPNSCRWRYCRIVVGGVTDYCYWFVRAVCISRVSTDSLALGLLPRIRRNNYNQNVIDISICILSFNNRQTDKKTKRKLKLTVVASAEKSVAVGSSRDGPGTATGLAGTAAPGGSGRTAGPAWPAAP